MRPQPLQLTEISEELIEACLQGWQRGPFPPLAREIQDGYLSPEYQAEVVVPANGPVMPEKVSSLADWTAAMPRLVDTAYRASKAC